MGRFLLEIALRSVQYGMMTQHAEEMNRVFSRLVSELTAELKPYLGREVGDLTLRTVHQKAREVVSRVLLAEKAESEGIPLEGERLDEVSRKLVEALFTNFPVGS